MARRIPPRLYKYASLVGEREEYVRALIVDQALYFSSPTQFNDPFECRFRYSMEASLQQWRRFCSRPMIAASLGFSPWTPPSDDVLREWATTAPANVAYLCQAFRSEIERETGICCFSEKHDDILMWSHYADSHRGVCLEFEPRPGSPLFRNLSAVRYQDEYPVVNFITLSDEEWVNLVYATKASHWSYEAEWRVLAHRGGSGIRQYAPGELTAIILGSEAPPGLGEQITAWVRATDRPIKVLRARCSESAYRIQVVPHA